MMTRRETIAGLLAVAGASALPATVSLAQARVEFFAGLLALQDARDALDAARPWMAARALLDPGDGARWQSLFDDAARAEDKLRSVSGLILQFRSLAPADAWFQDVVRAWVSPQIR